MDKNIVSHALCAAIGKEAAIAAKLNAKKSGYGPIDFKPNCLKIIEEAVVEALKNDRSVVRLTVNGRSSGLDVQSEETVDIYEVAARQRFYLCEDMSISTMFVPVRVEMVYVNPPYMAESNLMKATSLIRHAKMATVASKLLSREVRWGKTAKVKLSVGDVLYIVSARATTLGGSGSTAAIIKASVIG